MELWRCDAQFPAVVAGKRPLTQAACSDPTRQGFPPALRGLDPSPRGGQYADNIRLERDFGCHPATVALTMSAMATNPKRDLDREEVDAVLAAHPGMREHLEEMVDQYLRGELRIIDDEHLGRILEQVAGHSVTPD